MLSTPHGALGTEWCDRHGEVFLCELSTPHGALGTNWMAVISSSAVKLSTPHGALGTNWMAVISSSAVKLSTPHGALGTRDRRKCMCVIAYKPLSTPHGALGTYFITGSTPAEYRTFNSTRCIRNRQDRKIKEVLLLSFQLHTVH